MTVVFAIKKTSFLDFAQQNINIFLTNPNHTLCLLMNFHQKREKKITFTAREIKISRCEFKLSRRVHSSLKSFHS